MAMKHGSPKRQFLTILTIVFLGFLGISMPYLIFPSLFLNPAHSILPASWSQTSHALFLGITLAAYPLGQFIGSPILGALSDDYGRKKLLAGSLIVSAFCNLLTGLSLHWQQVGLLIASRFAAGLMEGNIAIVRAMASDIKSISKHDTFGKINAAASIAFLVGPFLGGLMSDSSLYEGLTVSTPFYFTCLLFIGLAVMSIITLEEKAVQNDVSEARSIWQRFNLVKRLSVLFQNQRLKYLMIVSTAFTLSVDIFYEFGPVYLTAKWMLEPVQLTLYNAVLCVSLAIGNGWLATFVSSYCSRRHAVIWSGSSLVFLMIGIVLAESTWVMLLLFTALGLAVGLVVTMVTVKISDSVSDAIQGEVMGVQVGLRVLGDAVICLIGGALLLLSPKLVLLVAAIIAAVAVLYYVLCRRP